MAKKIKSHPPALRSSYYTLVSPVSMVCEEREKTCRSTRLLYSLEHHGPFHECLGLVTKMTGPSRMAVLTKIIKRKFRLEQGQDGNYRVPVGGQGPGEQCQKPKSLHTNESVKQKHEQS